MRYYLDFDRTCFDTDAFVVYMQEHAKNVFEPGELSRFLYSDAASFLREKENAVTIITAGDRAFQEMKVKSALHGIPRMSVMYTEGQRKGDFLAPHTHLHIDALLVDDTPAELEAVALRCPDLLLYEMRRNEEGGDGRWPIIHALAELP